MATKKQTATEFRQRLETVTAQARASESADVADFVAELVEVLCRAYDRGGIAETRRALKRIDVLIEPARRPGEGRGVCS